VKSTDQNLQPSAPKTPREIGGTRKLVGLDTRKRDDRSAPGKLVGPNDPVDGYFLNRVVQNPDSYFEVVAKDLLSIQVLSETVKAGKRVTWEDTARMADHVSFVIVLGRPDEHNRQAFACNAPRDWLCHGHPNALIPRANTATL
jgi:hypothetical protein